MPAPQSESMIRKTPKAQPPQGAANFFPQPPVSQVNGKKITAPASENAGESRVETPAAPSISFHDSSSNGKLIAPDGAADEGSDLDELVTRTLRGAKRGRPAEFDDHAKGKLVALLALGLSLRQAASVLGVSHTTIRNVLKADPALAEEITAARFNAQVQPLACVVRESRRSWKAATWLLKYLDGKIADREETPEERRERNIRESEETIARAHARSKAMWDEDMRESNEKLYRR